MRSLIQRGAALLLTLQLPAASAAEPLPQPALGPDPGSAFTALNRCANGLQHKGCLEAEAALKAFMQQQDTPDQRLQYPRCLGALSHVETVLAVFRWRLETNDNLHRVITAAQQQCPPDSAAISQ